MQTVTAPRSAVLSYLSLFTSLGTLFCCALPSLFVLFGLGASVASVLAAAPWLVALSRHKNWTFTIAGVLIAAGYFNLNYLAPRLRSPAACVAPVGIRNDASACDRASRFSQWLLWFSTAIYLIGVFVAFALGPILAHMDAAQ